MVNGKVKREFCGKEINKQNEKKNKNKKNKKNASQTPQQMYMKNMK